MIRNSLSNADFEREIKKKVRCHSAMPANNRYSAFNASFSNGTNQRSQNNWLKHKATELVKVSDFASKRATSRRKVKFDDRIIETKEEMTDEEDHNRHRSKDTRFQPTVARNETSVERKQVQRNFQTAPDLKKEDDEDVINFIDNLNLENFIDNLEEKYQIGAGVIIHSPEKSSPKKRVPKIVKSISTKNHTKPIQNEPTDALNQSQSNLNLLASKNNQRNTRPMSGYDKENQLGLATESKYICLIDLYNSKTGPKDSKERESMQTSGMLNRTINEEELEQMSEPQAHKALSSLLFRRNSVD